MIDSCRLGLSTKASLRVSTSQTKFRFWPLGLPVGQKAQEGSCPIVSRFRPDYSEATEETSLLHDACSPYTQNSSRRCLVHPPKTSRSVDKYALSLPFQKRRCEVGQYPLCSYPLSGLRGLRGMFFWINVLPRNQRSADGH